MPITLIGGGSRSGKSSYALLLARECGGRLAFVATAQALDEEMQQRCAAHRRERGEEFTTFEEPLALPELVSTLHGYDAAVIDCLTLWLSNMMLASPAVDPEPRTHCLMEAARVFPGNLIFVTNEVGCGIVPENSLARRFRDEAGRMNQRIAGAADAVYWMAFGCPLKLK